MSQHDTLYIYIILINNIYNNIWIVGYVILLRTFPHPLNIKSLSQHMLTDCCFKRFISVF